MLTNDNNSLPTDTDPLIGAIITPQQNQVSDIIADDIFSLDDEEIVELEEEEEEDPDEEDNEWPKPTEGSAAPDFRRYSSLW